LRNIVQAKGIFLELHSEFDDDFGVNFELKLIREILCEK